MSAVATSTSIKRLIIKEYRKDNPLFSVIKHLQTAFQEALAHENRLSVDNMDDQDVHQAEGPDRRGLTNTAYLTTNGTATTITGANIVGTETGIQFTGNATGDIVLGGGGQRDRRRPESDRDQYLSAMDQAIQRASQASRDPMVAVVQALPNLDVLYPDEEERQAVVAAIREEVRFRLGERMPPPTVESEPATPLLTAGEETP